MIPDEPTAADPRQGEPTHAEPAGVRVGEPADPGAEEFADPTEHPTEPPRHRRRGRSAFREYLEAFLIAVIFATFAKTYVVQAFKIPTGSMEENLLIGDHILVNKFVYGDASTSLERFLLPSRDIRRGDVVVFKFPENPRRDFIKRCIGLPGDEIELLGDVLRVNGEIVEDSSYVYYLRRLRYRQRFGPVTVPPDHYFCMGDNRDNSRDSRSWGPVPASHVKGRAFMVYWSYDGGRESLDWPGYWGKIRQLAGVTRGFLANTRWSRSFTIIR
jgi:signal peptidase I